MIHNNFRSTLAKIAKIYSKTSFYFNKCALFFWGRLFSRKKTPGGHAGGLAKWGGITKIGFRCPKSQNVVWKPTGLTKRFLHVQNPKMSFGNLLGLAKRFLDPKSENVVWKPTGAN